MAASTAAEVIDLVIMAVLAAATRAPVTAAPVTTAAEAVVMAAVVFSIGVGDSDGYFSDSNRG